jgi:NADPH:quinone reductase-like Zn-dependent oxidoreductase
MLDRGETIATALTFDRYGGLDVLEQREISLPPPGPGEVLVRVRAAALNPKDSFVRKGRFRALSGARFPKRVGVDFAGEALVVGRDVAGVEPGDRVFGALEEITYRRGTLATHVVVAAREVARMPAALAFEDAAALPLVALTSLQALRDLAAVAPGDRVLVHGASGGVGTAGIQIARALGAVVDATSSPRNFELCRSLGAAETLDYAAPDLLAPRRPERAYRAVFDAFGNLSYGRTRALLAPRGVYVGTVPSPRLLFDAARTWRGWPRARLVIVRSRRADLDAVRALVEQGRLRAIVDRVLPLADARAAFAVLESKRARGKIVLSIP